MSVYIVTGKLGNGKTLVTVGRIRDALRAGRRIATNLDINLVSMFGRQAKAINLMRIPDKPNLEDLNAIGKGYEGEYDEDKFGILVLDECGTWFNSRNWQDKTRKDVNDWFLHARKLGWHVYIIIQDISMLDSQARDAIGELLVTCKRLDKIRVPIIGGMIKTLTGFNPTLPRIHRAKVAYADGLISDVWVYRGNDLFPCYDTRQSFIHNYSHGTHSILTPWHTHGRYSVTMTKENIMRITKIYWKRFKSPVALGAGLLIGAFAMLLKMAPEPAQAALPQQQAHAEHQHDVKLAAKLSTLIITGSMRLTPDRVEYDFRDKVSSTTISTSELTVAGVAFHPRGSCRVDADLNGHIIPIYCL